MDTPGRTSATSFPAGSRVKACSRRAGPASPPGGRRAWAVTGGGPRRGDRHDGRVAYLELLHNPDGRDGSPSEAPASSSATTSAASWAVGRSRRLTVQQDNFRPLERQRQDVATGDARPISGPIYRTRLRDATAAANGEATMTRRRERRRPRHHRDRSSPPARAGRRGRPTRANTWQALPPSGLVFGSCPFCVEAGRRAGFVGTTGRIIRIDF